MTILDFKEIPAPTQTKNRKSDDLDAFEKFAEHFFVQVKGAKLLDKCARGADNGIDLKIDYNGEICLVSCKHKAHSGDAVNQQDEKRDGSVLDSLLHHKCTKFIGFYSTIASTSLKSTYEGVFQNQIANIAKLSYEFFYNSDIEAAILDVNNPRGWIFAARYFPRSFCNLFNRFIIPIEYYSIKDIKKQGNGYKLDGPYGVAFCNESPEKIVKDANDALTSSLHKYFFYSAIQDAINLFPHYFMYKKDGNLNRLSIDDVSPAWDYQLDRSYSEKTIGCNIPIIICAIWSMWDFEKASMKHMEYRSKEVAKHNFLRYENKEYVSKSAGYEIPYSGLNIAVVSKFANGELRNLFARLIAFCPAGGVTTKLNIEKDPVQSFDPEKIGKSNVDWQFDLTDIHKWLRESLENKSL